MRSAISDAQWGLGALSPSLLSEDVEGAGKAALHGVQHLQAPLQGSVGRNTAPQIKTHTRTPRFTRREGCPLGLCTGQLARSAPRKAVHWWRPRPERLPTRGAHAVCPRCLEGRPCGCTFDGCTGACVSSTTPPRVSVAEQVALTVHAHTRPRAAPSKTALWSVCLVWPARPICVSRRYEACDAMASFLPNIPRAHHCLRSPSLSFATYDDPIVPQRARLIKQLRSTTAVRSALEHGCERRRRCGRVETTEPT